MAIPSPPSNKQPLKLRPSRQLEPLIENKDPRFAKARASVATHDAGGGLSLLEGSSLKVKRSSVGVVAEEEKPSPSPQLEGDNSLVASAN